MRRNNSIRINLLWQSLLLLLLLILIVDVVETSAQRSEQQRAAASSSSWWPAIFGRRDADDATAHDVGPRGMHSAYLASKSSELKGLEGNLVSEMHRRARTSTCWKDAVATLENRCRSELTQEDQRSRMALHFTACQLHHDGKVPWDSHNSPHRCARDAEIADCVGLLEDYIYPIYVQFHLHVDTLCFHAQEEQFQERTEIAVANLDRISNTTLARTRALANHSALLLVSLGETREAQSDILAQTRNTSEWLQGQYLLHQGLLGTMAQHTNETSHHVAALGTTLLEAKALHEEALLNVKGELASVLEAQQSASEGAKALATSLATLAASSETQMLQHQVQLEHVALRTQRMAEDAATQQQHFLQSHTAMIELLERVFTTQQYIAGSASLVERVVVYVCGSVLVLVATSILRLSSARPHCLILLLIGWYIETYCSDMLVSYCMWQGKPQLTAAFDAPDASTTAASSSASTAPYPQEVHVDGMLLHASCSVTRDVRCVVGMLVGVALLRALCCFVSPEEAQRRLIIDELRRWWGQLQAGCNGERRPNCYDGGRWENADGGTYWDQQDNTLCAADVWVASPPPPSTLL